MFGRTVKASIAKDNGRTTEFIRRREYPDKTKCYECGEYGHLSYKCSKNALGERDAPAKKVRKRKKKEPTSLTQVTSNNAATKMKNLKLQEQKDYFDSSESDNDQPKEDDETLSAAIAHEQEKQALEDYRYRVATGNYEDATADEGPPKKLIKKSSYFSDEEESD